MKNIFDYVDQSIFWGYLKTALYFPMPFVLITVAILLIENVIDMIKNVMSKPSHDSEDYEEWDDDD